MDTPVNVANDYGNNALHYAFFFKRHAIIETLVKARPALLFTPNVKGKMPSEMISPEKLAKIKGIIVSVN